MVPECHFGQKITGNRLRIAGNGTAGSDPETKSPAEHQRGRGTGDTILGGGKHVAEDSIADCLGFGSTDMCVTNGRGNVGMPKSFLDECQISAIS